MSDVTLFSPSIQPLPEPDWGTAPEWAHFWTIGRDGCAGWYRDEPFIEGDTWVARGYWRPVAYVAHWRESLRKRPTRQEPKP